MSLTEAEHLFAGLHEAGANDFLRAFFTARPHRLNYRSSPAVGPVPPLASAWTTIPSISFPGVPGGVELAVQFSIPTVDLDPDTLGVPPPLVFAAGEFSLRTTVTLAVLCGSRRGDDPDHPGPTFVLQQATFQLVGLGRIRVQAFGAGSGELSFEVEAVEIVDIKPNDLESLLECLILQLLRGALSTVRLPFSGFPMAAGLTLLLQRGPEVEDDQAKLYGDAV